MASDTGTDGRREPPKGIVERHARCCPARTAAARRAGARCAGKRGGCTPTFEAFVWSPSDGKKIRRTFTTAAAARGWRRDSLSAVANGRMRAPAPATIADEARAFIDRLERGTAMTRSGRPYKPKTARNYQSDLERIVIPELGGLRLSQLRRRHVQALVDELRALGVSGSKVQDVLNALRAALRRALVNDEITSAPLDYLELPPLGEPRDRAATPEEAAALLEPLDDEIRAIYATGFYAGLRRGELRALRVSDFNADLTEIHVQRGWDDVDGEIEPKSKKGDRRVPVAPTLRLILLEHLARTGRRGDDLVFGRTATEPFTPSWVRKRALAAWGVAEVVGAFFRQESIEIPLEPILLHECRHTFVSIMHAAGRSLEEIGDYVGHTSAYMTERYRHLLDGARAEAAAALDAFLVARAGGAQTGAQARSGRMVER